MKAVHRISLWLSAARRKELDALDLKAPAGTAMPSGGDPFVAFDVDEGHPNWPALQSLFQRWGASDIANTKFSKQEIFQAQWLELAPDWHHGYPQPEQDFGYRGVTYDASNYCEYCGIGLKQRSPFWMKDESKWGRNNILQLNWVFDEFFVTPEFWREE